MSIDYKAINDFIKMNDKMGWVGMKGHIKITDLETGETKEKDNLILYRLRLLLLQILFRPEDKDAVEAANGYITNDERKICLFKIGSGGADVQATALQPFVPKYNDEDLAKPIPFVITTPDKYLDPDYEANPSMFLPQAKEFNRQMRETYHCPITNIDETTGYYAKEFDPHSMRIVVNKDINELYAHMTLSIDAIDARGYSVNELGLLLAEERYYEINPDTLDRIKNPDGSFISISYDEYYDLDDSTRERYIRGYEDEELISRVTFDTESLRSLSRKLLVEYRVYA